MIYRTDNAAFDLAVQNAELIHQNARSMATSTASSISSTSCRSRSPARVGLWSKADSRMYFSDFTVTPAD